MKKLVLSLILTILSSQSAFCVKQPKIGDFAKFPKELIVYIIYQSIENIDDPVKAYKECEIFCVLNKEFHNLVIETMFSKFKNNECPTKLHLAVKINAIQWIKDNIHNYKEKINSDPEFRYSLLRLAMTELNPNMFNLLISLGFSLESLSEAEKQIVMFFSLNENPNNKTWLAFAIEHISGKKIENFDYEKTITWTVENNLLKIGELILKNLNLREKLKLLRNVYDHKNIKLFAFIFIKTPSFQSLKFGFEKLVPFLGDEIETWETDYNYLINKFKNARAAVKTAYERNIKINMDLIDQILVLKADAFTAILDHHGSIFSTTDLIELFLSLGFDVNHKSFWFFGGKHEMVTLLELAIREGHMDIAELLMKHGAKRETGSNCIVM